MMFEELKKIVCDEIEHTLSNIEKEEIYIKFQRLLCMAK